MLLKSNRFVIFLLIVQSLTLQINPFFIEPRAGYVLVEQPLILLAHSRGLCAQYQRYSPSRRHHQLPMTVSYPSISGACEMRNALSNHDTLLSPGLCLPVMVKREICPKHSLETARSDKLLSRDVHSITNTRLFIVVFVLQVWLIAMIRSNAWGYGSWSLLTSVSVIPLNVMWYLFFYSFVNRGSAHFNPNILHHCGASLSIRVIHD